MSLLGLKGALLEQGQALVLGEVGASVAGDLIHGRDGLDGISRGGVREVVEGCEQTADYGLRQRCGYPAPDPRPLATDISAAGHARRSYTRSGRRVNQKRTDGADQKYSHHTSGLARERVARRHNQSERICGARAHRACFGITHHP